MVLVFWAPILYVPPAEPEVFLDDVLPPSVVTFSTPPFIPLIIVDVESIRIEYIVFKIPELEANE